MFKLERNDIRQILALDAKDTRSEIDSHVLTTYNENMFDREFRGFRK